MARDSGRKTEVGTIKGSVLKAFVLVALSLVLLRSILQSEKAPAPPLDEFAGRTVVDPAMGLAVIDSRAQNYPKVGEQAPDFELHLEGDSGTLRLSDLRGGKPVVLVFGSYT